MCTKAGSFTAAIMTVKDQILNKCAVAGKANGASKAVLFEKLKATVSTTTLELALQDLLDKGKIVKMRRDRYILNERNVKTLSATPDFHENTLQHHITKFKVNHHIILKDI